MRRIIHLDLDAFYASVEQRDRPELRGLPVLVGGSPERGVVCACSYEARRFGIHSAMAMAQAVRLCPQAVVLPVRMAAYREASGQVFAVFSRYTDRIEPLSHDEAFLDMTGCERLFGPAREIARRIKEEVRAATGLIVSAGVAPNKFLAKLASDLGKPDGLLEVTRGMSMPSFCLFRFRESGGWGGSRPESWTVRVCVRWRICALRAATGSSACSAGPESSFSTSPRGRTTGPWSREEA